MRDIVSFFKNIKDNLLREKIFNFLIFLAPLAALAVILRGPLFFNQFFLNNDVILQLLPYLSYRPSGVIIVQNFLSGFPLFVTTNASWFYPVSNFLFTHADSLDAYKWLTVGNITLAYVFSWLFARRIGISASGAVFAAMLFLFSGQVMLWMPSTINTNYYFLLPAVLFLFEWAFSLRGWSRIACFGFIGAVLGIGWLSGHIQFVFYIHVFYCVYVCARLLFFQAKRFWSVCLFGLFIPYALSAVVGLPMILAVLRFQPETLRANGVDFSQSVGGGYLPWDIVHFFLPFWNLSFFPSTSPNLYMGILPLMLLAIFAGALWKTRNAFAVLFASVLAFCVFSSIRYSPVAFILHALPFWSTFREPQRIMFIGGFAAAMLCGMALDYLTQHWKEVDFYRSKTIRLILKAFLLVAVPLIIVFTLVRLFFFNAILARIDEYVLENVYPHTTGLPKEHYLAITTTYLHQLLDQFSLFDWQMVVFVVCTAASLLLLRARALSRHRFAALAIVLVALNFAAAYGPYYEMVDAEAVTKVPHTVEAIRSFETGNRSPFRVYSVFPAMTVYNDSVSCTLSSEDKVALQNELLLPNAGISFGIDSVEGYENFMPELVSEQLGYIGSENTAVKNPLFLQKMPLEGKIQKIFDHADAMRAFNVKYVISGIPLSQPEVTLLGSWKIGICSSPVYLYQLVGTWPRYFVTNQAAVATSSDASDVFDALNAHETPFVLYDQEAALPPPGQPFADEVVPALGERDMRFEHISCSTDCALFVGNAYLRGWSATVDGMLAQIYRANYVYMALALPAGTHDIVFTYR